MREELTKFQNECLKRFKSLLSEFSIVYSDYKRVKGKSEDYCYSTLNFNSQFIEVYIYEDEVGYMINKKEWSIFESPDYATKENLINAFIDDLKNNLLFRKDYN